MALVFTKSAETSLFNLAGSDRLGRYIITTSKRQPFLSLLVVCLLSLLPPLVAYLEGNWSNPALELDASSDIGWWNQFLLALPTLVFVSGLYLGSFPKTLRQLVDAGVILATEDEWKSVRRSTKNYVNNPLIFWLPYLLGFAAVVSTSFLFLTGNTWVDVRSYFAGWFVPFYVFLLFYFAVFFVTRIICVYLVLKKLFRFKINIQPFHSDGCGGLKSLGELSARLGLGIFVFGIIVAFAIYTNAAVYNFNLLGLYNLWMLGAYIVTATIAFFLPLQAAALSMETAKQMLILQIAERTEKLNKQEEAGENEKQDLENSGNENINALNELKKTVRAMQVWPFNITSIAKFLASIGMPIVTLIYFLLLTF